MLKLKAKILGTAFYVSCYIDVKLASLKQGQKQMNRSKTRAYKRVFSCMYYVILVTTGQYKTRTAVGRPHLVRSPRFIPSP